MTRRAPDFSTPRLERISTFMHVSQTEPEGLPFLLPFVQMVDDGGKEWPTALGIAWLAVTCPEHYDWEKADIKGYRARDIVGWQTPTPPDKVVYIEVIVPRHEQCEDPSTGMAAVVSIHAPLSVCWYESDKRENECAPLNIGAICAFARRRGYNDGSLDEADYVLVEGQAHAS